MSKKHWYWNKIIMLLTIAGCVTGLQSIAGRADVRTDSESFIVLDERSVYRWHFTYAPEIVRLASGSLQEKTRRKIMQYGKDKDKEVEVFTTAWPAQNWREPDFDDSEWQRSRGPLLERTMDILTSDTGVKKPCLRLVCLRGRFSISDPAAIEELNLSLSYRGGVVVWLNGKEIARGHMPDGTVGNDTLAMDYPDSAYVTDDGIVMPAGLVQETYLPEEEKRKILVSTFKRMGISETNVDRCLQQSRVLENIRIPASILRKGINVLAIEIHRAPTAEAFYTGKRLKNEAQGVVYTWPMIGLEKLKLTVKTSKSNSLTFQPTEAQVWVEKPLIPVYTNDYCELTEKTETLKLVTARNGYFSGQVLVRVPDGVRNLQVAVSDLQRQSDDKRIPSACVQVRYALPNGVANPLSFKHYCANPPRNMVLGRFDGLTDNLKHCVPGILQVIWVTLRVPSDAQPGIYRGTISVRANGISADIPLNVEVIDYLLPDPTDFGSFVELVQSPRTISIQYGVPMWSARHWTLLEQAFALLGQVGARSLYIPVICDTHHGNGEYTMIHWVRRADGTFTHDFSIFERYLDTAIRHLGKKLVVCLYIYDPLDAYRAPSTCIPLRVMVRDEGSSELHAMDAPAWDSAESEAFWKPVLAGAREILARRGMADTLAVGVAGQGEPKPAIPVIERVDPNLRWVSYMHYLQKTIGGKPTKLTGSTITWIGQMTYIPWYRFYGWKEDVTICVYFPRRFPLRLDEQSFPVVYHAIMETVLASGFRGIGWCGADFWDVVQGTLPGSKTTIVRKNWSQLELGGGGLAYILSPGPDGPLATVRLENLREGLQEAEARITIERALTDSAKRNRLGEQFAKECETVLDERIKALMLTIGMSRYGTLFQADSEDALLWYASTSQERARKLFELAGRVLRAIQQ